jgi:general secretion pathway protein B
LPDAVRQQLPALAFSGATYSANPLYRMVIVNGQVLHEGDTAALGVVLEKIEQQQAVLRFRGYRYAVGY